MGKNAAQVEVSSIFAAKMLAKLSLIWKFIGPQSKVRVVVTKDFMQIHEKQIIFCTFLIFHSKIIIAPRANINKY